MTTEAHQPLRDYIAAVRGAITPDDVFGQHLVKLIYRDTRSCAHHLFSHVRAVADAVIADGGTLADARTWTSQAIRWWRTGKAVEQKFARFEIDQRTVGAMEALLKLLQTLPDDLLQPQMPPRSPFGSTPSRPGTPPPIPPSPTPTAQQPAQRPGRPFGAGQPAPQQVPPPPAPTRPSSPFGGSTAPANPFGSKPPSSPFGTRPFFGQVDSLPFHVAACFDALAVVPDSANKAESESLLDMLNHLTAEEPTVQGSIPDPLPDNLKGLLECWRKAGEDNADETPILQAIGRLGDLRVIDFVYNVRRDGDDLTHMIDAFTKMGGDVGIAGLFSLLPLENDTISQWLTSVCTVTREAMRGDHPLSEASLDSVWKIALAESAPTIAFYPLALELLAATGRKEAQPILWQHAHSPHADHRRVALFALVQSDPDDDLDKLLIALEALSDAPQSPFGSPFGQRPKVPPVQTEPVYVGIPFEGLAAIVQGPKINLRLTALKFLSYINDPRVMPFLITQLARRIPAVREAALIHLRRLHATSAANAVAKVMDTDKDLRQKAADALFEWDDSRCVPVLLEALAKDVAADAVIKRLGKFGHLDFAPWLMKTIEATTDEDILSGIVTVLGSIDSGCLRVAVEALYKSSSVKVKQAIIGSLGKVKEAWASDVIHNLTLDASPLISYRAAALCDDTTFAEQLLDSTSEVKRLIAVRLLWQAKATVALLSCLSDKSVAVSDSAVWALGQLQAENTVDTLRQVVEEQDLIDKWNMNPAVVAWRALVRLGAVSPVTQAS
ncbi:MAG: HEAT repeat domain-containing protein [Chloroflexota bacterium]